MTMNKSTVKTSGKRRGTTTASRPAAKPQPRHERNNRRTCDKRGAAHGHRNIEPVRRRQQDQDRPVLRFTPDAWAKLLWLRDRGPTEVGGFGITAPDDPLRVIQFVTVRQYCTLASVSFEDEAVADFFEDQLELGRRPEQCGRIWIHTHPGDSANPSGIDEATFARVFGVCDWAVMVILATGGATYARLRCNVGPGMAKCIPVDVDYTPPFGAADAAAWEAEYQAHIQQVPDEMLDPFGELDEAEVDPLPGDPAWLDQFAIDAEVMALLGADEQAATEVPLSDVALEGSVIHEEQEVE